MARKVLFVSFVFWVVSALAPGDALAQVDGYHFTGINFDFANPGARARGIGGAFVALADDATSALANPAGLAFLDRQFSLEFIHDEEKAPVGQVTQGGVGMTMDDAVFVFTAENDPFRVWAESESNRINYASFVFPIPSWKMGVAVYYASLADIEQDYEVGTGLFCVDGGTPFTPGAGESCQTGGTTSFTFYYPQEVTTSLQSELVGAGFGWRLSDTFSIGGSIGYVETSFNGFSHSVPPDWIPVGDPFTGTSSVDDSDVAYSAGLLYRGDVLGLGLSYRSETQFEIQNDVLDEDGNPFPGQDFIGEFRIPERLAAGLAVFPGDNWVIAGEYVKIPYSQIPDGMPLQFDVNRQNAGVEYTSADVDEYHVGLEYTTFGSGKGWSIRVGYWRDESHLIYSSQGYPTPITDDQGFTQAEAAFLYEEFTLEFDHFTAGFGAAFGKFRLDAAVDYSSDAGTDFLLSGVFYF